MASTRSNLLIHLVYGTKHRAPLLEPAVRDRLFPYLSTIFERHGAAVIASGGVEDHIHLLVRLRPGKALAAVVRQAKSSTTGWLNRSGLITTDFSWQTGYGAFSVSASAASKVIRYIHEQPIHHQRYSFRAELITLLERHGIEYDARYLLD